jgi:hypothetical protein
MIIRLVHAAILQGDFLRHLAHCVHDSALGQVFGRAEIDNVAANGASDPDFIYAESGAAKRSS